MLDNKACLKYYKVSYINFREMFDVNLNSNELKHKSTSLGSFSVESENRKIVSAKHGGPKGEMNYILVNITGTIDLLTSTEFQAYLLPFIEKGNKFFVLDFTKLDFIDSMGLSTIIMLYQKVNESGGRIVIINPKPSIMVVFKVTKLNQRISIFGNIEEASAFLAG